MFDCFKRSSRPSKHKAIDQLWIPFAEILDKKDELMKTKGEYFEGHPEGAVVHYTSGRYGLSGLKWGRKQGYCYLYIDHDGTLYQSFPLNRWGEHAGKSEWPSLGRDVSDRLVGIELACAGMLKKDGEELKTWYEEVIPPESTRLVINNKDNQRAGWYHKYTDMQEKTLEQVIIWLARNSPVFDLNLVLGHDEVSPGRKQDPGGSLSMTMPEFRRMLKKRYES